MPFSNRSRFGRTPEPSNGDSNNASVPSNYLRRSSSSAHHREPRSEAYRSATPAVLVASSTSRHRTNAERTRPPLVEDEIDADEIYRRIRAAPLQPSQFVGWQQHPAPESITLPPTRPSTARPIPVQDGLRDLSRAVASSNKYASAHGVLIDACKASLRGFFEADLSLLTTATDVPANFKPSAKCDFSGPGPYSTYSLQTVSKEPVAANLYTHSLHISPGATSTDGTPPTDVVIPKSPSRVPFASTFISLCRTLAAHPATVQLCAWSSLIGLAQAASVDQSLQTPVPQKKGHKILLILLPILFLLLLVASLVAMWWARRRAAHRAAQRGIPAPRMPSRPMSTPPPVYLRLTRSESLSATSRARHTIFSMADRLSAGPIVTQRSRREWSKPEIIITGFGLLIAFITLVVGGVTFLYTKRQVSRA